MRLAIFIIVAFAKWDLCATFFTLMRYVGDLKILASVKLNGAIRDISSREILYRCKYLISENGCMRGDSCEFSHRKDDAIERVAEK